MTALEIILSSCLLAENILLVVVSAFFIRLGRRKK